MRPVQIPGSRILVTGASRGIGRALAERLARDGARLALLARSREPLEALASRLGGRAYALDLAEAEAVEGLIERIEADGGGIDVLVNNAGVSHVDHVLHHDASDIERIFRTNLLAPIHLCRQVIPRMLERGRGHIVNVSSLAAVMTPPGLVHYGASKAALSHYTAGLRQDLRDLPITTTLVEIGSVPTELDDASRRYAPLRELARRSERSRFGASDLTPIADVVEAMLGAIREERRHVRLPRALAPLPMLAETPRRLTEWIFRGIDLGPRAADDA